MVVVPSVPDASVSSVRGRFVPQTSSDITNKRLRERERERERERGETKRRRKEEEDEGGIGVECECGLRGLGRLAWAAVSPDEICHRVSDP